MVDIPLIEKRGGSIEELRKKFTTETPDAKIKELVDLNAYRIDDGINQNLHNARLWYAIDRAFDVSERQVTHTLVEGMLDAGMNGESVMDAMKTWGISHQLNGMLSPLTDSDGNAKRDSQGRELMKLDLPTFFNIFVPLVAAYVKIRWSKLFGDRDIYPSTSTSQSPRRRKTGCAARSSRAESRGWLRKWAIARMSDNRSCRC